VTRSLGGFMPTSKERNDIYVYLLKNLKNMDYEKEINMLYLLYGEETYLLENYVKKIKKDFGELKEGINYIKIDNNIINEIISDIETPAFGYDRKLIIARDTNLFKKDGRKKVQANQELVDKIAKYIEENIEIVKDFVDLIFIEQEVNKNNLYTIIEKNGEVKNFEELKLPQLVTNIKNICQMYKVNIDDSTIKYFIECCGTSMQELINEIRKLIEFIGENGTITKQSIDLLCTRKLDSVIFDLTDNLGQKKIKEALIVLNNLIYSKEPIQKILITLYNHFKKLYLVKLSEKYNKNLAESLGLKPNQMFLTTKYKTQANYFKENELRNIIEELINLDSNYKIGKIDLNVGLESILCEYCS